MRNPTPKPRPARPRTRVLVMMHGNGLMEVFAERDVDVLIVNRLHVAHETPQLANEIDLYTEGTIPRRFRELCWPSKCRAVGFHERVTPAAALDALYQLEILRGIRELREREKPIPQAIQQRRRA